MLLPHIKRIIQIFCFGMALAVLNACANIDNTKRSITPPFKWDSNFVSPGTSLMITEKMRHRSQNGGATIISYELKSVGFSAEESVSLWWKRGSSFSKLPAKLSDGASGVIQVLGTNSLTIAGYVPGQALELAIVSMATDKRAHAKAMPFPIQAQGDHGCSVSAEIATESGLLFIFSLRGFQPGEEVQTTSRYNAETKTTPTKASDLGEVLGFPVLFETRSSGMATLTAKGKNCTVSLDYNIGKDALVAQ